MIYKCAECGNEVKHGENFCASCGNRLVWRERKTTHKAAKRKNEVRLNVDHKAVSTLCNSALGLGIGIFFCSGFGIIIGIIILVQRSGIKKWLSHLQAPNYYEGIPTSKMLNKVRTIMNCCAWGIGGSILFCIGSFAGASSSESPASAAFSFVLYIIGIILCFILRSYSQKVIDSSMSGQNFYYERSKGQNEYSSSYDYEDYEELELDSDDNEEI